MGAARRTCVEQDKVGSIELVVPCGRAVDQRIKLRDNRLIPLSVRGVLAPRCRLVISYGAGEGPKGSGCSPVKWHASWVQNARETDSVSIAGKAHLRNCS